MNLKQLAWPRLEEIRKAAFHWYGNTALDALCLAENRLMRGETPT